MKYTFKLFAVTAFPTYKIIGFKLLLKGKVNVAGNARTRKVTFTVGTVTNTTVAVKPFFKQTTVPTYTGVLGLKILMLGL